jgi:hypothetical protein
MAISKLPQHNDNVLRDGVFITVDGPNGVTTGFSYDLQQRAFYFKESQVIYPSFHGVTHIAEDPIPPATCDTPGLMSSVDKCRLDSLLQMRVGVLGFQGSGFPEDGGWLQGDVILAAGSGFISLERFGNVVRFTVDSPIPLNCRNEQVNQIYWVQDGTDTVGIRPPVSTGKLPNINGYGELSIYTFPEATIADPANPEATTNNKTNYPAFLFKRQLNSVNSNSAYHEMILRRDPNNLSTTDIGWVFSPPSDTAIVPSMIWYMGKDTNGNQIKYEFEVASDPNLLGAILYKGNTLTKQMGVIVEYPAELLSTNNYHVRFWDTFNANPIGTMFTAKNVWQYNNPENATNGTNPKTVALDAAVDILPVGTLVDLWSYSNGVGKTYFFNKKPTLNPSYIWNWVGHVQFGDVSTARKETPPSEATAGFYTSSESSNTEIQVEAIRDFEHAEWGLTGFDDPLLSMNIAVNSITDDPTDQEADVTYQHRAVFDSTLPGLVVRSTTNPPSNYYERPVYLWHRKSLNNAMIRADIGRPDVDGTTVIDFIIRSKIDSFSEQYMEVIETGLIKGRYYIRVAGVTFKDLPPRGSIRVLPAQVGYNQVFNYAHKVMFPNPGTAMSTNSVMLVASLDDNMPFLGDTGDICELLHEDYSASVVRCEFFQDTNTNIIRYQVSVGSLDVGRAFVDDNAGTLDDLIRGLAPGYAVSSVYTQADAYDGVGTQPTPNVPGFVVYEGGSVVAGQQDEYWNRIEIMVRDDQVWVWWNQLLIPPNTDASAALTTPVSITSPYYTIPNSTYTSFGKYGVKMFPGAKLRQMDVRTQMTLMNEFVYGQLNLS